MMLSLDYRIEIPLILAQRHISGLRSFYDEGEMHFNIGVNDLKDETDHLTPEEWNNGEDCYLGQRDDLEELRELKRHFSIVGLFTVFEKFLQDTLQQLRWAGAAVRKRNPKERWFLGEMKEIFAEIGVPITKPDRDWNAIKRMEAVRHCITHLGSLPNEEMVDTLAGYNFRVREGVWMELSDGYFEKSADLVERVCKWIVKDCQKAVKEKRIKARARKRENE